jgi:splicing factor 3A subunit 3
METLLEQQRRYHEERERLEDAVVQEKIMKKSTHRDQINSEHRVKELTERSMESAYSLAKLYEDEDGLRKEEIQSLSGPNELAEFYERLRHLKEFHRRYPGEIHEPMQLEFMRLAQAREHPSEEFQNLVDFSDEEGYGKYLDLHSLHREFVNIKGLEKLDYLTYLANFDQLFEIPKEKKTADYKRLVFVLQ